MLFTLTHFIRLSIVNRSSSILKGKVSTFCWNAQRKSKKFLVRNFIILSDQWFESIYVLIRKRCQKNREYVDYQRLKEFFQTYGWLSKIRSVHTYVILRTVYFGWICSIINLSIKCLNLKKITEDEYGITLIFLMILHSSRISKEKFFVLQKIVYQNLKKTFST